MRNQFRREVLELKNKKHVDQIVLKKFLEKIDASDGLVRDENLTQHICSFFLPINLETKTVYIGNHKKAGGWIPPGGHINKNETPIECVRREFLEELRYKLTNEKIELFDLSIININNPRSAPCKVHYDIWYLVHTPKLDFNFTRDEFYIARWVNLEEVLELPLGHREYTMIFNKLVKRYS